MHKVIKSLISEDQTGYIKGRFIGTNIRLIQDIIEYTESSNMKGIILQLDFQKAYGSLEWNFMFRVLKKFKFGTSFINWIRVLYKNPVSYVKNNGWMSSPLKLQRSVKQGCPISGLIFLLAVEVLSLQIKQSEEIKGIEIMNEESNQATEIRMFIKSSTYIHSALNVNKFGLVSGLKLNLEKTEGILLGLSKNKQLAWKGFNSTR